MKLPTKITLARVGLSPLFVPFFFGGSSISALLAFLIALTIELTDILDGYLARSRNETSAVGKILDPFADSISRFTIFICFLQAGWAELWMILAIFYRDTFVQFIRVQAASKNIIVAARGSGKLKAIVQGTGINVLLALNFALKSGWNVPAPLGDVKWVGQCVMAFITVVTLYSAVDYFHGNRHLFEGQDF